MLLGLNLLIALISRRREALRRMVKGSIVVARTVK